jgi:uncharacterized membrane protein YczE
VTAVHEPPAGSPPATAPQVKTPPVPSHRPRDSRRPGRRARVARRLTQLYLGLVLFGVSMALLVEARLGVMPWDVLHQGLARRTGLTLGTTTVIVGVVVLLMWIPLRERPGLGTVSNVLVIGVSVDAALALLPAPDAVWVRAVLAVTGIVLNAVATAMYIGARYGAGPRDGLMTGLVRRTGASVRLVKTSIEVGVVAAGWLLGGTVGVATVLFALTVGALVHVFLPRFTVAVAPREVARLTATSGAGGSR